MGTRVAESARMGETATYCVRESGDYVRGAGLVTQTERLPEIGRVVAGKYRIERLIGRGGMGAVFAARHEVLGNRVALKWMPRSDVSAPSSLTRFFNEARAVAALESDHVARVLDVGELEGGAFIALELLEGADLEQVLSERGPLPVHDVVDWVLQGLEALAEAHSLGIVHRDLKPANLFCAKRRDGSTVVKVLDFGISKQNRLTTASPSITTTMAILGSPAYMAPEQLRDAKTIDRRADIWAMGVVLYELLAGRTPFVAQNFAELFLAIFEHSPPPLHTFRRDLPAGLEEVVMRCLSRDAAARFQDVAELALALTPFARSGAHPSLDRIRHIVRTAPEWTHAEVESPLRRRSARRIVAAAGLAAGIGIAAAGIIGARVTTSRPPGPPTSDAVHRLPSEHPRAIRFLARTAP
jgi:serine/threonine protein kinase